jgi:hypothetical protein
LIEIHIEVEDLKISLEFYKRLLPHDRIIGSGDKDQVFLVLKDGSAFGIWVRVNAMPAAWARRGTSPFRL